MERGLNYLTTKKSDEATYAMRFEDLAIIYPSVIGPKSKKIEAYVKGATPQMQKTIVAAKPDNYKSSKKLAFKLTEQASKKGSKSLQVNEEKVKSYKKKWKEDSKGNSNDPRRRDGTSRNPKSD